MVDHDMTPALENGRLSKVEPAYLRALRLRALRRAAWMRSLWAQDGSSTQGLAITEADVNRILTDPAEMAAAEEAFYRADAEARQYTLEIAEWERAAAGDERWQRLTAEFGLSTEERDLLALALAVESDPWWRRVCGYLHDDASASQATLWLASGLYGWTREVRLGPSSPLVRWHMAQPAEGVANPWAAASPWTADPQLLRWLVEGQAADGVLGMHAQWLRVEWPCLYPETLAAMKNSLVAIGRRQRVSVEIEIAGPKGAGRGTLAAQLCASLGIALLAVDAQALAQMEGSAAGERVQRAVRLARLCGGAVLWRDADALDAKVLKAARREIGLSFYATAVSLAWGADRRVARLSYSLPRLTQRVRCELWRQEGGGPVPRTVADSPLLPEEIAAAARASAGEQAVALTCHTLLHSAPGDLLQAVPLPYEWDDIVLPEQLRRHLEELESQVRLRNAVLEDWGFERLTPLGRGISALFAGPSGTGKTMAAQVMARSLGLALRRVDLSAVVNKYIGETEKHLKQVFDACERDSVILFFDEADALFGQRTQVKDAHDRFANIEINYLLQRMEQFDGLAILATNRKEDLDKAFLRRLRFLIDFLPPGVAERRVLWRKALPERTPEGLELLEEGIQWEKLASQLDLTGAAIKAAALRAAFLACEERSRIGMRHIVAGVRREMQKQGRILRANDLEEPA
ncbi:MAG: ATP-binding protein [Bryobacterales bacterium]|nr:ATP-binding protein [Bryobacterales bacterium]